MIVGYRRKGGSQNMSGSSVSEQDWAIRLAVYRRFIATGRPPDSGEIAGEFGISPDEASRAYQRLHAQHALYVDPGTGLVRMANPLSAVRTAYRVSAGGVQLWANCAWDSLGIPAMLHADARIEAVSAISGETISYAIESGALRAAPAVVHFPVPFDRWYDDLIHT
jgi:Alkylmercury lyase